MDVRSQFTPPILGGERTVERSDFTPHQLALLRRLDNNPAWRVRNGYRFRGDPNRISMKTADRLKVLCVAEEKSGHLRTTIAGRAFVAKLENRAKETETGQEEKYFQR